MTNPVVGACSRHCATVPNTRLGLWTSLVAEPDGHALQRVFLIIFEYLKKVSKKLIYPLT